MSYEEFRKRIDTARQILVGAVPSPAGQIDQITYALMYKFMNDIDDQAAVIGGKRTYFAGDYAKFNWHELMKPGLEAHDQLELYRQAIQGMSKNPSLPPLFREIYQNAFLPFNSPTVLRLFLDEISKFDHGDTDDIGDAYEYLLSITGAQGDVGQFRTPRHIIKFIVEAVNPTKTDSVLDPAVGTAGFLIAAYNHVKHHHDGVDDITGLPTETEERLTADETDTLHKNYRGFDIDPTMVRTASVNLYLHGFTSPDIRNHDSLSSEDYWNDRYDVILANPPFMSPKGGIQPHKKFGISANRAEVLFVDYIASHLKPNGRAGVIVPEGIIFQSGKAYKELRKNLVENYLYAVVSLPAGVFNPYAGVKTSVLLLDKELAKERDEILFVKIENDGYSLGAQRRPVTGDQFPEALELIEKFKAGEEVNTPLAHGVGRDQIGESGDYNLSGDRYKTNTEVTSSYPLVELGELCEFIRGITFSRKDHAPEDSDDFALVATTKAAQADGIRYDDLVKVNPSVIKNEKTILQAGDLLISVANSSNLLGRKTFVKTVPHDRVLSFGAFMGCLRPNRQKVLPEYINPFLESDEYKQFCLSRANTTTNISNLNWPDLSQFEIPLPPIEIQREIVAELDGYKKIIDAAQTILKTYKPTIKMNPEWEVVILGDHIAVNNGQVLTDFEEGGDTACIKVRDMNMPENANFITTSAHWTNRALKGLVEVGSVIFPKRGAAIATNKKRLNQIPCYIDNNCMAITVKDSDILDSFYLYYFMLGFDLTSISNSAGVALINNPDIKGVKIPLPPIEIQREIVAELEAEQKLIDANKKLIEIYQQKIKSKIAEVWGE